MDITPFNIDYLYGGRMRSVEIRPCCREDNVVDYAVWYDGKLYFTITRNAESNKWVVALKNADDEVGEELVQLIGAQIEKRIPENIGQ
ncbi:MAG TPA: hypothetical protein VHL77_11195 [Ferruginibacter sp.]|jgi:hypothetical protein|nr:hypothetical protein [Ferruginibacter sp.]